MSDVLQVSHQEAIRSLHQKGWSHRRIARELGINRRTVRPYVEEQSKCTSISTPARVSKRTQSALFDPRRGEYAWAGTGGLGCRSMGSQESVPSLLRHALRHSFGSYHYAQHKK